MGEIKRLLDKESIWGAPDMKRELVDVPEWGGAVYVSTISARAALEIMGQGESESGGGAAVVGAGVLLARAVVNEDGAPLFTIEEIDRLMLKSNAAVSRVLNAALRINNFNQAAEDAEKNLNGEAGGSLPSASPVN